MLPSPDREPRLERALHLALRRLPHRSAPASLEPRVLAELARREDLPWWRLSFPHWPLLARLCFLALSAGLAGLGLALNPGEAAGWPVSLRATLAREVAWLDGLAAVASAARQLGETLLRQVPPAWFFGAVALVAAASAACLVVAAAAFQSLRGPDHE